MFASVVGHRYVVLPSGMLPQGRQRLSSAMNAVRLNTLMGRSSLSVVLLIGLAIASLDGASVVAQETEKSGVNPAANGTGVTESERKSLSNSDLPIGNGTAQNQLRDPTMPTDRILQQVPQSVESNPQSNLKKRIPRQPVNQLTTEATGHYFAWYGFEPA